MCLDTIWAMNQRKASVTPIVHKIYDIIWSVKVMGIQVSLKETTEKKKHL